MPCGMVQVCGGAHVVGRGVAIAAWGVAIAAWGVTIVAWGVAIAARGGDVQIILKGEVGDGAVGVHEVVVAGVDFADGLKGLRVGV